MSDELKFNREGLIPAVAQDVSSGDVLMMAWMNAESLAMTMNRGLACFYSRNREKLWIKGEKSGNFLWVKEILLDCDGDTLLLRVSAEGPACHTGKRSCFYRSIYIFGETADAGTTL